VQGAQGGTGAQGTQGSQGVQGFQGTQGFQGVQGTKAGAQSTIVTATGAGGAIALCPAGTFAVGGGFADPTSVASENFHFNRPIGSPATGWQVTANNARVITVYAVCTP
jgi:hypothetical protein